MNSQRRIFSTDKKTLIENPNLKLGFLKEDKLITKIDEIPYVAEEGHYEIVREYPNGGKDIKWVVDVEGQEYVPEIEQVEEILIYVPYSKKELEELELDRLRALRETECFTVINRGKLWYDRLTSEQFEELNEWYTTWLDITKINNNKIREIPQKPKWM